MKFRSSSFLALLSLVLCFVASLSAQQFSVSVGTSGVTIHPGDNNVPVPVSLTGDGTYSGPVTVTLTGLPSGITVTPVVLTPGGSGTLTMSASVAADQEAFPPNGPATPDTATSTATLVAIAGAQQSTATFPLTVSLENPSFAPKPSDINLPIVQINTSGVPIVDKTADVPGTISVTSANGQTSYLPGSIGSDNTATFHLHGNSTLLMPKKAYHMKLTTSVDLLGGMGLQCPYVTGAGKAICDKAKTYDLLANYDDKTLLRDWAASALANDIPIGGAYLGETASSPSPSGTSTLMPWAPHSLFVELYLNGQYEGNYQLIEEIKVDSHRVNVTEMADTDTSGTALTGGYLMEIDTHEGEDYQWVTPQGVYVGLDDPDFTPEEPEQTSYITDYVNQAEAALYSNTYTDPVTGWRAYFDEASAVNFYIVNDLLGNTDGGAFISSDYIYKDRNNPLLYMGPVWDFDISSGNVNYEPNVDPTVPWMTTQAGWYIQLFTDPSFKASAQQQWNALKNNGVISSWLQSISDEAETLEQSQRNNFGRWPMQGIQVWPNPQANGSYDGEVNYLLNWITARAGYMDGFLNNLPSTTTTLTVPPGTLRAGSPATLTAQVTGNSPTGKVTFLCNSIVIGQAPLDGTGTATLSTSTLAAGNWNFQAYYNGDSGNALSESSPVNATVLPPQTQTVTNLATSGSPSYGSPMTLTAAVVGVSRTTPPTGTVSFTSNGNPLGSAQVSAAGVPTLTTSALALGANVLQASYSGDLTYTTSVSNNISETEGLGSAIVTLTNLNPTYNGSAQAVTVTTQPAGLNYTITYNGAPAAPTAPGSYSVVVTITDPDYTGSATANLIIAKVVAHITWAAPAAITYGTPLSAVQFNPTSDVPGSFTYSPNVGTVLPRGVQTLSATLTPTDETNYAEVTKSVQLVVNQQATTTTLVATGTSINPNQTVTLTATVAAAASGSPTGSVSFFDGTSLLAIQPLANGTAAYSASLLSGSHTITASYSGDGNYSTSQSVTGGIGIQVAPLDFTFSNSGAASAKIAGNTSTSLSFSLTPLYGAYPDKVSVTVTGLPPGLGYTITPATIVANQGPTNIVVTFTKAGSSITMNRKGPGTAVLAVLLLVPFVGIGSRRRMQKRSIPTLLLVIVSSAALCVIAGCGSEPPQTYSITVTATSGAVQHSVVSSVIVQ